MSAVPFRGPTQAAGAAHIPAGRRWLAAWWEDADRAPELLWAAGIGVLGAVVLGLAGLPPVNLHGPLHRIWGIMDPLCGGTRAVYWMARGRLGSAWTYNPGTFVLPLFVVGVYGRAFYGYLTGRWVTIHVRRGLLLPLIFAFLLILEINQQAHAALLLRT